MEVVVIIRSHSFEGKFNRRPCAGPSVTKEEKLTGQAEAGNDFGGKEKNHRKRKPRMMM